MVGAVGIENNHDWNFRDLQETSESAKSLKNSIRERNGVLIAPLKLPRFSG
jgi:hypothetical protein